MSDPHGHTETHGSHDTGHDSRAETAHDAHAPTTHANGHADAHDTHGASHSEQHAAAPEEKKLSSLANSVIQAFEHHESHHGHGRVTVNPLIATVVSWYEKFRNAMEFRQEEVVLRSAIERILKRRLLLGGTGKVVANPLVRELIWGRYFNEDTLPDNVTDLVAEQIDIYLFLRHKVLLQKKLPEGDINEWMLQLMSAAIERLLHHQKEREMMNNLVFQILRKNVSITDDSEQTKDVQVFLAVRKSFAKDDVAFLRYHLLVQFFGTITKDNVETVAANFVKAYREVQRQLHYKRKDAIYNYVKRKTGAFFILEDILRVGRGHVREITQDKNQLQKTVLAACDARYKGISSKVRRALMRSVIFVLFTKAFFAFAIEGTFESMVYGHVLWNSILLNTTLPPLIMIFVGLFIHTPGRDNSLRILNYIRTILFEEQPKLGAAFTISKNGRRMNPLLYFIFSTLWFFAFLLSFGIIIFVLTKLQFNFISQGIFLFFLTIVSFLCYRISLMANVYSVDPKTGLMSPIFDFFFMPIIQVGRNLTEGISQINVILFLFDFVIETPFKGVFGFFEQWFVYLHQKREGLE